jgi:hypothetical protein
MGEPIRSGEFYEKIAAALGISDTSRIHSITVHADAGDVVRVQVEFFIDGAAADALADALSGDDDDIPERG